MSAELEIKIEINNLTELQYRKCREILSRSFEPIQFNQDKIKSSGNNKKIMDCSFHYKGDTSYWAKDINEDLDIIVSRLRSITEEKILITCRYPESSLEMEYEYPPEALNHLTHEILNSFIQSDDSSIIYSFKKEKVKSTYVENNSIYEFECIIAESIGVSGKQKELLVLDCSLLPRSVGEKIYAKIHEYFPKGPVKTKYGKK